MIGLISRTFIDELLSRTDIVDYIDGFIPLKKRGSSHIACCPFHNEKNPSFNVVPKKQFYHCFGCGANGNAISFAMNYLHLGFSDAVESLATRLGMTVIREGQGKSNTPSLSLYQFLNHVSKFYQKSLKSAGQEGISYLKQRGVTGEIAHLYELGFAPKGWQTLEPQFKQYQSELKSTGMLITKEDGSSYDRFRQRLMFPIHDRHGRVIGFGGRAIDETQKPKYLNSPETILFQKSRELYGLHQVLQQKNPIHSILIVEGYMDVIALAQHGIKNVVATLGTATSTYHIQLLSKYCKKIIFCFDGDTAGRQAATRALENSLPHLNSGLDASFIFLPDGHDPDSLVREEGASEFSKRLEFSTPLNHFFIDTLTQNIDCTTLAGKTQLINAAKPSLLKMPDGPYRQLLIDEIARITRVEPQRLLQLIEEKSSLPKTEATKDISRSPIRMAIALLLQHPEIYKASEGLIPPDLLDNPKQRILKTLMQQIAADPEMNTAKLIELWRESRIFNALSTLATWDHQVPEDALKSEFVDILLFLSKQNREYLIQQLLKKAHDHGLSETERHHLQRLLKERHQI